MQVHAKGLLLGGLLLVLAVCVTGAGAKERVTQVFPIRFRVVEIVPDGVPSNGRKSQLLKLSPFYGKISQDSATRRNQTETQEITTRLFFDEKYEIHEGDILAFEVVHHLRRNAGNVAHPAVTETGPQSPDGRLGPLGRFLTIAGVETRAHKAETGTILVDTVDGRQLDKPIPLLIQNLRDIPAGQRIVVQGYESGAMIGKPAEVERFEEQAGTLAGRSQVPFQWRPYFVVVKAVEPHGLEFRQQ